MHGGGARRQGVEAADVDAEVGALRRDPHLARREEEIQGSQDRGDINYGIAHPGREVVALWTADLAAVVLDVGHRRRTHGQQDQRDAGGDDGQLEHGGSHGDQLAGLDQWQLLGGVGC